MRPTLFVCDSSTEADTLGRALRDNGYAVVDVPLSLLVSRVAAQRPSLVLLDVDAEDALEVVRRVREIPGASAIPIVFVGEPGKTSGVEDELSLEAAQAPGDVLASRSNTFFARPVSTPTLLRKIAALVPLEVSPSLLPPVAFGDGELAPESGAPPSFPDDPLGFSLSGISAGPSAIAHLLTPPSSAPPAFLSSRNLGSASAQSLAEREPMAPPSGATAGTTSGNPLSSSGTNIRTGVAHITTSGDTGATGRVVTGTFAGARMATGVQRSEGEWSSPPPASSPVGTQLSDDIQRVLALAEERVAAFSHGSSNPPSPEEEIEAVLPADILDALDEPMDADDLDDNDNISDTGSRRDAAVLTPIPADSGDAALRRDGLSPTPGPVGSGVAARAVLAKDRRSSAPPTNARPFGVREEDLPFPSSVGLDIDSRPGVTLDLDDDDVPSSGDLVSVRALTPFAPVVSMPSDPPFSLPMLREPLGHRASPPPADGGDAHGVMVGGMPRAPHFSGLPSRNDPAGMIRNEPRVLASTPRPPTRTQHAGVKPSAPSSVDIRQVDALGPEHDGLARVAEAVASRFSGALTVESAEGARVIALRDGDFLTISPASDAESLVSFLTARGDIPRDAAQKIAPRLPSAGRHAGAALVAHGLLAQDDLWTTLRGHAEWLLGQILSLAAGTVVADDEIPPRLRAEPSVFGGSAGAEVLVEVTRRFIPADQAVRVLGGSRARIGDGATPRLLSECALPPAEAELAERARGFTIGEVLQAAQQPDFASVLLVLVRLGVLATLAPAGGASLAPPPPADPLDEEALRSRIRARLALVDEGDYFSILGVPRTATPYEIRRAYLALRRTLEPARVLTPTTTDLAESLRLILDVLDEAFEILRDPTRRERYRRAIESPPG